jgi:hypothetical protein
LLDRKNEIVVGTVTSVVIVRMKKGKNCPCTGLETVKCSKRAKTHLFIVVVVGPRHCDERGSLERPVDKVSSERRKERPVCRRDGRERSRTRNRFYTSGIPIRMRGET